MTAREREVGGGRNRVSAMARSGPGNAAGGITRHRTFKGPSAVLKPTTKVRAHKLMSRAVIGTVSAVIVVVTAIAAIAALICHHKRRIISME